MMKNFRRKLWVYLLSFPLAVFLVSPCCQIVYAQESHNNHCCCSQANRENLKNLPHCPIDSSSNHHSTDCPKAKNFLEIKNTTSLQFSSSRIHSGCDDLFINLLNTSSPQTTALSALTDPHRNKQNSIPLYLLHSILRI